MFKSWYSFVVYCVRAAVRFGVALLIQVAAAWVVAAVLLTVGRMFGRLVQTCGFDISCLVERYRNVGALNCCLALMLIVFAIFHLSVISYMWHAVFGCILPKKNCKSPYVEDSPINGDDEDLLGRKSFEDKIIDLIRKAPEKDDAQYIGIWGAWGVGKTSVMRRIEWRMLHEGRWLERPIFVHFDPLRHSGGGDLMGAMFAAMAASRWLRFYGVGGILGCVGSRMVANRILAIPSIRHWTFDVVRFFLSLFFSDRDLQDRLADALRNIGRRIVVVIDDLDRLPKEEMCAIVRMLKSVGGLPNVTYVILANECYLAGGVGSMVPKVKPSDLENGREYLRKIISEQADVPDVIDKSFLVKTLRALLGHDLKHFGFKLDVDTCEHLYFVKHFLSNIRDVKRLANGVRIALEGLLSKDDGVGVSVDIGDLVVLEGVRMKWPEFYDALPKMFTEFLTQERHALPEGEFLSKYLKLVPEEGRVEAQLFITEFLDVRRQKETFGSPAKMRRIWKLEDPSDYKKYEAYRLSSEFCFDNYFETERSAKVVPRAYLETVFDYVWSGNIDELVKTMQKVDELSSLPELLYVLQRKYQDDSAATAEILLRSLVRIFELPLKSFELKSEVARFYGVLPAQILRFAKELLSRFGKDKLKLMDVIAQESDSYCLFAALLREDADRIQKGESPWYVDQDVLPELLQDLYERAGNLWRNGIAMPGKGFRMAQINIERALKEIGVRTGGLAAPRRWAGVEIPSIEIVIVCLGDAEKFKNTLWSVLASTDAYGGAVSSKIVVFDPNVLAGTETVVEDANQSWVGANIETCRGWPSLTEQWVTFVREGDFVSRNWFSLLAFESFHVSVDIVSFDYYQDILSCVQFMRRDEIYNSYNLFPYMNDLLAGNYVAACFWNKMYKSCVFSGPMKLPSDLNGLVLLVTKIILASNKLAHVDQGLLCHVITPREDDDLFSEQTRGYLHAGERVMLLQGSPYENVAFKHMIRSLDRSSLWKWLFRKQFGNWRIVDALCPQEWRVRRLKLWICSKVPVSRHVLFLSAIAHRWRSSKVRWMRVS